MNHYPQYRFMDFKVVIVLVLVTCNNIWTGGMQYLICGLLSINETLLEVSSFSTPCASHMSNSSWQ